MKKETDSDTVEAIKAFTYTKAGIYEPPDAVQVATIAAILSPTNKPDDENIEEAVLLIARSKEMLKRIRAAAAQPAVDFGVTVSVKEAAKETGLTERTIKDYASQKHESGKPFFKIENGRINKLSLASIRKLEGEKKTARAKAGYIASKKFKGKKRKK